MKDELDTLRSFRPEVTGPTDALARDERNAFMQTITQDAPGRDPTPRRRRRLPRGRRVVLALAVALVAVGGAAGAARLIPDDVQQALGLADRGDPALAPNVDQAVRRTSIAAANGGSIELWTAPTKGGGTCAYLRHLDAAGKPADGAAVTCQNVVGSGLVMGQVTATTGTASTGTGAARGAMVTIGGAGGDSPLNVQIEQDTGGELVAYGLAPSGTARLVFTGAGGIHTTATPTADGWFVVALPGADPTSLQSIEALSASGTSLARVPLDSAGAPGRVESGTGPESGPGQTTAGG